MKKNEFINNNSIKVLREGMIFWYDPAIYGGYQSSGLKIKQFKNGTHYQDSHLIAGNRPYVIIDSNDYLDTVGSNNIVHMAAMTSSMSEFMRNSKFAVPVEQDGDKVTYINLEQLISVDIKTILLPDFMGILTPKKMVEVREKLATMFGFVSVQQFEEDIDTKDTAPVIITAVENKSIEKKVDIDATAPAVRPRRIITGYKDIENEIAVPVNAENSILIEEYTLSRMPSLDPNISLLSDIPARHGVYLISQYDIDAIDYDNYIARVYPNNNIVWDSLAMCVAYRDYQKYMQREMTLIEMATHFPGKVTKSLITQLGQMYRQVQLILEYRSTHDITVQKIGEAYWDLEACKPLLEVYNSDATKFKIATKAIYGLYATMDLTSLVKMARAKIAEDGK